MAKFGINDIMDIKSKTSGADGANDYKEIWLNPYEVKPSDSNFYAQENIEELADSFLAVGQQQPTVLGKVDGQFWIVSGHRRNRANILNIERGHQEYQQVRYLYKDMTQPMLELSLLMGNAYNRELTAWEKTQQAKRLKEALIRAKKEDGLEIPGKLRDVVAGLMNESSSNIAKMESITHNAVQEIQDQFKNGNMGISAAYEAAKLSPEEQKAVAEKTAEGKKYFRERDCREAYSKKDGGNKGGSKENTPEQSISEQSISEQSISEQSIPEQAIQEQTIQKEKQKEGFESNTVQKPQEEEKSVEKMSHTEKVFQHKKILREWEKQSTVIARATKRVADAIKKVSESNTAPQKNWKDIDWTVFLTKAIMHRADQVSEEDLYLLHDIMSRCQKKERREIRMDETMERIKFIERRLIFVDDLKNLCADKNLYTMGDEECLGKMLNKCRKPNITTEDIIEIAKDIHIYSHLPEGMDFTDLCSEIAEISHSFFERITMD